MNTEIRQIQFKYISNKVQPRHLLVLEDREVKYNWGMEYNIFMSKSFIF
jgi:hypothetical protein